MDSFQIKYLNLLINSIKIKFIKTNDFQNLVVQEMIKDSLIFLNNQNKNLIIKIRKFRHNNH